MIARRGRLALVAFLLLLPGLPAAAACGKAPDPVVSLSYASRYVDEDASRATIDPRRKAEAEAAVAPVDEFIQSLADETQRMYSGPASARAKAANCVLKRLATWAEADALSALETETVRLTVGARYAAFALILWQTLPYSYDHEARQPIQDWLSHRMKDQMSFWEGAAPGARQGNLRAWAGLAAAAVSVQTGDLALRDWAGKALGDVICSANPDGSLPQEMSRGRLALHYQLHAIAPLVTAAAILERQDIRATRMCDGALIRIVDFVVADLQEGQITQAITGAEQSLFDGTDHLRPYQLAWIEAYLSIEPHHTLEAIARDYRPLSYSKLGGNQTELWGR